MNKLPLPEELKLENYSRRAQSAVFDRIDLVIDFRPGKDNIGATVKSFLDAIIKHDLHVHKYEEKLVQINELRRDYRKKNRLFRNLDSAWNVILTNPTDFNEYLSLIPKVQNAEQRLEEMTDPHAKARLSNQFQRYNLLYPICSKQQIIYDAYKIARENRDLATKLLVQAERELYLIKEEEKKLAAKISDDHVIADEMHKTLTAFFPNVHVGFILSKINGEDVEFLPYEDVWSKIRTARPPHNAEFKRYDYRFDPFTSQWYSLQELRDLGVCVEDPLLQRMNFISFAAKGDKETVKSLLKQGEDPNATDLTGNTALVAAAAGQHQEIIELLFQAGANLDCRDKNMMTPLLYCVNRGYTEVVRLLIDLGADKLCMDRHMRGAIFYAVMSGNVNMVKFFLKKERLNTAEKLWGFTALHLAANQGDMPIVEFLLSSGCSIYRLDNKNRTAEVVAQETGHAAVFERLKEERLSAPAQIVRGNIYSPVQYWIGDIGALDPNWCSDIEITHIIYFRPLQSMPSQCNWLKKEQEIQLQSYVVPVLDEDADSNDNWPALHEHIADIIQYVHRELQQSESESKPFHLLICDDNGRSLSPAVMSLLLLMKYQVRIKESLQSMEELRPHVEIGLHIRRGLDHIQQTMDNKHIQRLNDRLRGTVTTSVAF